MTNEIMKQRILKTDYTQNADWSRVPEHGRGGLLRYIEAGVPPGSFLEAVISNDLHGACKRADAINQYRIFDYVAFLHAYAPSIAWGSPRAFAEWIKRGGWTGVLAEKDLTELEKSERQKEGE